MNKDTRLILESLTVILGELEPNREVILQYEKTKRALAPQSEEMGYEEDITEAQTYPSKNEVKKE